MEFSANELSLTIDVLEEYGVEMTDEMISIMKSRNMKNLPSELSNKITIDDTIIDLGISMPEYGYYASEGRAAGSMPPLAPIKKWVVERGMDIAAAYPIAKKIATLGTQDTASHFLDEFKVTDEFLQNSSIAFAKDLTGIIIEDLESKDFDVS